MVGRRDGGLMRNSSNALRNSRIGIAIAIGIFLGCVFAFVFPHGFFVSNPRFKTRHVSNSISQVVSTHCESSERMNMLKSEFEAASRKNAELKKNVRELTEKLRLTEQGKDPAQGPVVVLGEQHKAGTFGTFKGLRNNPTVIPDESVNLRLATILEEVAVQREILVALANSNVKEILEVWFTRIKKKSAYPIIWLSLWMMRLLTSAS